MNTWFWEGRVFPVPPGVSKRHGVPIRLELWGQHYFKVCCRVHGTAEATGTMKSKPVDSFFTLRDTGMRCISYTLHGMSEMEGNICVRLLPQAMSSIKRLLRDQDHIINIIGICKALPSTSPGPIITWKNIRRTVYWPWKKSGQNLSAVWISAFASK